MAFLAFIFSMSASVHNFIKIMFCHWCFITAMSEVSGTLRRFYICTVHYFFSSPTSVSVHWDTICRQWQTAENESFHSNASISQASGFAIQTKCVPICCLMYLLSLTLFSLVFSPCFLPTISIPCASACIQQANTKVF